MSACACMGPAGDCYCIRKARGQKIDIKETYISPELFALLSDEDKNTINELKHKALSLFLFPKGEQECGSKCVTGGSCENCEKSD